MTARIGIVGGGAWGTALALTARRAGCEAYLWARDEEVARAINTRHENRAYLPGIQLDRAIRATSEIADVTAESSALLLAIPAQHLRPVSEALAPHIPERCPIVLCAKGIEANSCKLMSEVLADTLPSRPIAVLSGPSFASEVALGLPTAVTLAAADRALGRSIASCLKSHAFRPYLSADLVGAQIGGAVKNVIALACGIVVGKRLGENARAALIARGLAEIMRLGLAMGAKAETFMGLSGLGDLSLTCNSSKSRNYSLGLSLGSEGKLPDPMAAKHPLAEGVFSSPAIASLAGRYNVEMPISAAVNAIINQETGLDSAIDKLLSRPLKEEHPWFADRADEHR